MKIRLLINNRRTTDRSKERFLYQMSDVGILNAVAVPELEMFRVTHKNPEVEINSECPVDSVKNWVPYYSGSGTLYSGNVEICAFTSGSSIRLNVKGFGDTFVSLLDNTILLAGDELSNRPELLAETVLSPAFMLTLANSGYFALHGSALETSRGVFVFCGESGQGKSTLARELDRESGLKRLADDIVIWKLIDGIPHIYPFPQLKLPAEEQVNFDLPKPVKGFFRLDTANHNSMVSINELPSAQQLVEGMRHTVAVRLYTASMQNSLMKALPVAFSSEPLKRLSYPKRMESITKVMVLLGL